VRWPRSPAAVASAIRQLAQDDALGAELRTAGLHQAERFTPERFAESLARAYAGVIAPAG
jgi:glycosyltransferase involved in cell wall biosynthesis